MHHWKTRFLRQWWVVLDVVDKGAFCIYGMHMITRIFKSGNSMAVRIPRHFHPREETVSIVTVGDGWLIERVKPSRWPAGFFDRIRIEDPDFARPPQGTNRSVAL